MRFKDKRVNRGYLAHNRKLGCNLTPRHIRNLLHLLNVLKTFFMKKLLPLLFCAFTSSAFGLTRCPSIIASTKSGQYWHDSSFNCFSSKAEAVKNHFSILEDTSCVSESASTSFGKGSVRCPTAVGLKSTKRFLSQDLRCFNDAKEAGKAGFLRTKVIAQSCPWKTPVQSDLYEAFCPQKAGVVARVFNGVTCDDTQSPVIPLRVRFSADEPGELCTGTLIGARHILSVAHCFDPLSGRPLVHSTATIQGKEVEFNKVYFPAGLKNIAVKYPDGQFRQGLFNFDAAIIELDQPVPLTPAPLFTSTKSLVGKKGGILGYGLDDEGNAGTLRLGETLIMSASSRFIFANFQQRQFSDTCDQDSGGPLVLDGSVLGLTSDGTGARCGGPEISSYTDLRNHHLKEFLVATVPELRVHQ